MNIQIEKFHVENEQAMLEFAAEVATGLQGLKLELTVIYLHGELGAGKTTFTRGLLQALGHSGKVKSPTYTLVEPYSVPPRQFYHFDLYRLADPQELEFMGIRDYFSEDAVCCIEWPEKGDSVIPRPDLAIYIEYKDTGRLISIQSMSEQGQILVNQILLCKKS